MIDLIIPYVNGTDKLWQRDYRAACYMNHIKYDPCNARFRSWDNLQYVLRSIATYMPWINKLHLVLARESQLPEFINTSTVNVVYHKDFIPEEYLPLFNSSSIEMFIHRIPGLTEQFIYSNDDIFVTAPMSESEFFSNTGEPLIMVRERLNKDRNVYISSIINTLNLASKENNDFKLKGGKNFILRSNHSMNPMLIKTWKLYWEKYSEEIVNSITKFRAHNNLTQELSNYHNYMQYTANNRRDLFTTRNSKYINFVNKTSVDIRNAIFSPKYTSVCINDYGVTDFLLYKKIVNRILKEKYPDKCKYEI